MPLRANFYKHTLNFTFDAGTSRGILKKKDSYFIKIEDSNTLEIYGIGEAGPLKGLSPDFGRIAEDKLIYVCDQINRGEFGFKANDFLDYPSVLFALETAYRDLENGGKRLIFKNTFSEDARPIAINGLIWMGDKHFMKKQIVEKLVSGFTTLKLKIGANDFEDELEVLKFIREEYKNEKLTLRVDANGAFNVKDALEKLKRLADFDLHSIEQPIKAGLEHEMAELCASSPIPVALDEELIPNIRRKRELLGWIKPQYIILKPSLMGGISGSREWIAEAENLNIKWWMTSALESNIGLNAIAQFAGEFENELPQGLGTGQLYHNNFESPLEVSQGQIRLNKSKAWELSYFS